MKLENHHEAVKALPVSLKAAHWVVRELFRRFGLPVRVSLEKKAEEHIAKHGGEASASAKRELKKWEGKSEADFTKMVNAVVTKRKKAEEDRLADDVAKEDLWKDLVETEPKAARLEEKIRAAAASYAARLDHHEEWGKYNNEPEAKGLLDLYSKKEDYLKAYART